ncbi:MAG: DHH family phosphoesterase [Tyzzerella sp.]|nr:DHH family phosphoesterase [Tyzzerella sp.]
MLNRALSEAKTVAIGGHVRPDGDCVGSCMGLYQYIKNNYPEIAVDVYLEEIPDSFHMIEVTKEIKHEVQEDKIYDLFIALDCGDAGRLGFSECLFENARTTLCVDHHISNRAFADENYIVPEASSTSELIYRLLDKESITTEIAECLYLGIVHDTGVFQYSCTAPETMETAADLMRKNIRANEIIDKTFYEKTFAQNKILGKALTDSSLLLDGKAIAACITKEMMEEIGVTPKDLEGIVSQLRVTKGVEVAIFLYETGTAEYKVSLRATGTSNIDVSKVAQNFGGGGHKKAAGVTMKGKPEDILGQLVEQIQAQM